MADSHNTTQRLPLDSALPNVTIHGVFMDVLGLGVLLTGPSGVGKSELALGLINRGHRLVADDAPRFFRITDEVIIGNCPVMLQDFLEVRGLGILNVRAMFGNTAIKEKKRLHLIVNVVAIEDLDMSTIDRLHGLHRNRNILEVAIPEVTIPVASGRNLSVLVEAAVRNEVLKRAGYDGSKEFIKRQQQLMEHGE